MSWLWVRQVRALAVSFFAIFCCFSQCARASTMASIAQAPVDTAQPSPIPANPAPSSPPPPQATDPLASIWQSDAFAGQTFRFRLNGNTIEVYGSEQVQLGTLEGKEKKGVIDLYQGLVQIGPLTQCPGGRGLMQIKTWNESSLDAKIETPVNGANGITCGGVMGMTRLIPWRKVTFTKNTTAQQQTTMQATGPAVAPASSMAGQTVQPMQPDVTAQPQASPPQPGVHVKDTILYRLFDKSPYDTKKPFASQYPRVALTVVSSPPNHSQKMGFDYGGGFMPGNGCFTLRAKVWSSAKTSQDVGPFQWCVPQDLPKDFQPENRVLITPCDGCSPQYVSKNEPTGSALAEQKGVRNRLLYVAGVSGALFANYLDHSQRFAVGDDTTGTQRTDGPVPPDLCVPTDPAHKRYYASDTGGFSLGTNDGGMVLLMLDAMDLDLNIPSDRRAWIVRFVPATE